MKKSRNCKEKIKSGIFGTLRGHIFDQQSQALISLQPSIDLTTVPDNEISDIRKSIAENRIKNKLSLNTKNPVMKFDHFLGVDKNTLKAELDFSSLPPSLRAEVLLNP